jgi:hypothetical protein
MHPEAQRVPIRRIDESRPNRPARPRAAVCTALALATLAGGCSPGMDAIDRRIEKVVGQRASSMGKSTLAPPAEFNDQTTRGADRKAETVKVPPTNNPNPEDIAFRAADENRDVAARLDRFTAGDRGPDAKPPLPLTIEDALRISQRSGRDFLTAEEEYLLAAIRLLQERHRWGPRLSNDTTLGIAGGGVDGRFDHAMTIINQLKATQRLPYGGQAEAAWVWDATDQLREQATKRYTQASRLVFGADIPLLRGAGMVAQEELIQSERDLVYQARSFERFRRQNLVDIATDYFDLLELRAQIANQERQLVGFQRLQDSTAARVAAGRLSEFETNNAANQVVRARASLASLREQYILAEDRFKIRLGLDINQAIDVKPLSFEVPEPEVTIEEASRRALLLRLDLQNSRDQLIDARRAVSNARNNLLPDLNLGGNVIVPTDGDAREGGIAFDNDDTRYEATARLSLPLDREIEKYSLRATQIRLQQQERRVDRLRDEIVVSVRRAVRQIELQRFQLNLAEQQVDINRRRLEEVELKQDTIDPQKIVDAQNDLLEAENQRDAARTNLRNAVLAYLLQTDELRVKRDGSFQRLGEAEVDDEPDAPTPEFKPEMLPTSPQPAPQQEPAQQPAAAEQP